MLSFHDYRNVSFTEIPVITLYGIKSCDSVRKARRWLDQHSIEYAYHDLREDGLSEATAAAWLDTLGQDGLINRRSASWRTLPADRRAGMDDRQALAAVLEHPTLIRRPVLDTGSELHTGFDPERYQLLFDLHTL